MVNSLVNWSGNRYWGRERVTVTVEQGRELLSNMLEINIKLLSLYSNFIGRNFPMWHGTKALCYPIILPYSKFSNFKKRLPSTYVKQNEWMYVCNNQFKKYFLSKYLEKDFMSKATMKLKSCNKDSINIHYYTFLHTLVIKSKV